MKCNEADITVSEGVFKFKSPLANVRSSLKLDFIVQFLLCSTF